MDPGDICCQAHGPAQRINLPDHLPLGLPPNGWVATHLADGVEIAR